MAEQNLGSWFWDPSPPSPRNASFLIKATFPFLPPLASSVLNFEQQGAGPEFGNTQLSFALLVFMFFVFFLKSRLHVISKILLGEQQLTHIILFSEKEF